MNLDKLHEILSLTTVQLRKGAEITERDTTSGLHVTEVYAMPHESEVSSVEKVDLEFLVVGVNKAAAELHKAELIELLKDYPDPEQLAGGPSYIAVGAEIGDQGAAFCLFALGKMLGLWDVITPATMGFSGQQAKDMAGAGYIMITGFRAR